MIEKMSFLICRGENASRTNAVLRPLKSQLFSLLSIGSGDSDIAGAAFCTHSIVD